MSLLISNLMWHTDNHAFLVHLSTSLSLFYWMVGCFGPIGACLSWRNYPSHSFLSQGFCTYETCICFLWCAIGGSMRFSLYRKRKCGLLCFWVVRLPVFMNALYNVQLTSHIWASFMRIWQRMRRKKLKKELVSLMKALTVWASKLIALHYTKQILRTQLSNPGRKFLNASLAQISFFFSMFIVCNKYHGVLWAFTM